jgi:hypothetical protein
LKTRASATSEEATRRAGRDFSRGVVEFARREQTTHL